MTKLTGKTVVAIYNLTVYHDTRTDAGTKSNHNKVFKTTGGTVGHLAESCSIGIVCHGYGNTELVANKMSQREAGPRQIYSIVDAAVIVVGIGSAYTYTLNFVYRVIEFDKSLCFNI